MSPLALYIHVPFCRKKCAYCDFVSYAGQEHLIPAYFKSLGQELSWYVQRGLFTEYELCSVYIGGGTPSLATGEIIHFLDELHGCAGLNDRCEVTVEVNPGTISFAQFQQLRQAGCRRISIGVQSFQDEELRLLGRIHSSRDARHCVEAARLAGVENLSLDLMFGLPLSPFSPRPSGNWEYTLRQAIALEPDHLSFYNLTIEEGTPFWEQWKQGSLTLPDEEQQIRQYEYGIRFLTHAGYEHYEISNCARSGYRSRHNQVYWRNEEYLGLGAGAHSYLNGVRYWNCQDLERYLNEDFSSNAQQSRSHPPTMSGQECLDLKQRMGETIMMNLRLSEGISLSAFQKRFHHPFETLYAETIEKLCSLELITGSEDSISLTSKGILLSNMVFEEFIHV